MLEKKREKKPSDLLAGKLARGLVALVFPTEGRCLLLPCPPAPPQREGCSRGEAEEPPRSSLEGLSWGKTCVRGGQAVVEGGQSLPGIREKVGRGRKWGELPPSYLTSPPTATAGVKGSRNGMKNDHLVGKKK